MGSVHGEARDALDRGLRLNSAGHPAKASTAFRAALRVLDRADAWGTDPGIALLRSRSLLGLVISEFERTADVAAAQRGLTDAAHWARVAGEPGLRATIEGQRGLMHLRGGDTAGALAALDRAVRDIEHAEPVDACRMLLNRGSLLLELGRLDRARKDLEASAVRAERIGDTTRLFKARHNLGYLEFLAGDLPAALAAMADAATLEHDASPAIALLDRAQVLIEAGLLHEADQVLDQAGTLLAAQGLVHDLAQLELTRAHCARLAGRSVEAAAWALRARRRFVRRGAHGWAQRAELAYCQARLAAVEDTTARSRRRALLTVATRAETLAVDPRTDSHVARVARLVQAEALAAVGDPWRATHVLGAVGRLTGAEPLAVTVQARVVRARIARLLGDPARVRREVRAGHTTLAEHRRGMGSVEAVAAAAVHGARLTEVDLATALDSQDADRVLEAVERGRATFAGTARVRPPSDPGMADLLAELRRVVEQRRAMPREGREATAGRERLRREADRLRRQARERSWQLGEGTVAPAPARARELRAALVGRPGRVVDLVTHGGRVLAVVADATGSRLLDLAEEVEVDAVLRRLRLDLDVLARELPPALADVAHRSVRRGLTRLDELLALPWTCDAEVHVVAGGALLTVPWGALPSRAGRRTEVSPRLVLDRPRHGPSWVPPARAEVVALAGPGLVHADREVADVAERWSAGPGPVAVLTGERATCEAARAALASAGVVHLAAHGRHEPDNPVFSWLRLVDGPFFAHELEGLDLRGVVVVLSACEVGRGTVRPGGQVLGFAAVLLRLGARAVIAPLAPVRDDLAARLAPALHENLAAGRGPAEALAVAASGLDEPVPFSCFADGLEGVG